MNIIEERISSESLYEAGAASLMGTRKYQQDFAYVFVDSSELLAAVCDGMGGMAGGEKASRSAILRLAADFRESRADLKDRVDRAPDFLISEAQCMNRCVRALKDSSGMPLQAGTTFVGVYLNRDEMYWVSVGDSRIWLIRNGAIQTLNRDHNYRLILDMELRNGSIDRSHYESEINTPQADALISYLGIEGLKLIDGNREPIRLLPGDIVLLCSDGVYRSLRDEQVCAMVLDNDIDMAIAADRTNGMAMRYGVRGQDNTTSVCIRYAGG